MTDFVREAVGTTGEQTYGMRNVLVTARTNAGKEADDESKTRLG